ncbi:killer cell lectin-like receptor subfamily I member 1 isoform X1 [Cavia porcellus]|uniref:killer cell lectin-like receptor subfamily I member 1 isoform X1 n=1 Tax=Cavia porcellus TaxID=10141 RepID=UPI000661A2B4
MRMPKNRPNEGIVQEQEITYTDVKISKNQQKQRVFKREQNPVLSSEQEVNYVEMKFHRTSHNRAQLGGQKRKGAPSTAWKRIAGILAFVCIVLITVIGTLLSNLFSSREDQSRNFTLFPTLSSKSNDQLVVRNMWKVKAEVAVEWMAATSTCRFIFEGCSSGLCSHNWIGYGNSYYHFSSEAKTWEESQSTCAKLNSHLLKVDSEEDLKLSSVIEMTGWIAFNINENNGSWVGKNVFQLNDNLLFVLEGKNQSCAYVNGKSLYTEDCSSRKLFILSYPYFGDHVYR